MRIAIYGAGQFCNKVDQHMPFIAVDGGIVSLKKLNIIPKYVVGDFDSASYDEVHGYENVIQLPCKKDYSDTEVAIMHAIELGYKEIDIYGVTGGRLDHFIAVMRLLAKYQNVDITLYDDQNKIFLLKSGSHYIKKEDYDYISFYAIKDTVITLSNVEYPLQDYLITYDCSLCLSNEIIGEKGYVVNNFPIYCIQSRKGEL